jgi:hypothetical protein
MTRRAVARSGAAALGVAVVAFGHAGTALWRASRPRPGLLYLTAVLAGGPRSGLVFCRSADGGVSFEPARRIGAASGARAVAPVLAAGPAGSVCVIYLTPGPGGLVLTAAASAGRGATFGPPALARQLSGSRGRGEHVLRGLDRP